MVATEAKGEVIVDVGWALVKGGKVCGGVKENGPAWENQEKPLATIAAKVEKERPTLEVSGDADIEGGTKDCEARKEGVRDTYGADDCDPWLVVGFVVITCSWIVAGSCEPSP